jgi:hypothetical protein
MTPQQRTIPGTLGQSLRADWSRERELCPGNVVALGEPCHGDDGAFHGSGNCFALTFGSAATGQPRGVDPGQHRSFPKMASAASRTPKCNPVNSTSRNPCIPCSSLQRAVLQRASGLVFFLATVPNTTSSCVTPGHPFYTIISNKEGIFDVASSIRPLKPQSISFLRSTCS